MGLRDRLRERQLPTTTVAIRVDFSADADAAVATLARTQRELRRAEVLGEDTVAAQAAVDEAQAAVDAGYEKVPLRALAPGDFEALMAAHPPTDEQRKQGEGVNDETFRAPLLAESIDSDMTEADWAEWCTKGLEGSDGERHAPTLGEVRTLYFAAMSINDRSSDLRVGKE